MTGLADMTLRCSVVMLAALAGEAWLHRRSASLRHWVLTAGLFSTVAVGPLAWALPTWNVPVPAPSGPSQPVHVVVASPRALDAVPSATALTPSAAMPGVGAILTALWSTGVGTGAALLIAALLRLVRISRRATRLDDARWQGACAALSAERLAHRPIAILVTGESRLVATWGVWRPRVLLPVDARSWAEDRIRIVLAHEIAHIQRGDWIVHMVAEMLRVLFWFNPLAWVVVRRLRRTSEQACDDLVLGRGVPAHAYATHLLDIARACRGPARAWAPALPIAHPSTLEGRITAMLNPSCERRAPTRRAMIVAVATLLALTLPASTLHLSAQDGPQILSGSVYDTSGGVLPGVALTLEDAQSVKLPATTDAAGRFEFAPVGPGRYVLETSLPGFRALRHEFTLSTPRDWSRAITLQVGTLQETISVRARRPDARTPATAATATPLRVGGNIRAPRKLRDVRPAYPQTMREAGLEGVVPMEALIGTDGTVVSVRVVSAQVHPDFANAAIEAVRQWRFSPTLLNGTAVEVLMTVSVQFSLVD